MGTLAELTLILTGQETSLLGVDPASDLLLAGRSSLGTEPFAADSRTRKDDNEGRQVGATTKKRAHEGINRREN